MRIESLRALAALGVVCCHSWGFTNPSDFVSLHARMIVWSGYIAVAVFFALTGYLIFLPFARRDYGGGRRIDLGGYAINRGLRILPLYYAALLVTALAAGAPASQWLPFAVFAQNFDSNLVARVLDAPMWSLVVEVQFYLLLPLLAAALVRLSRGSATGATALLVALGLGSLALAEFPPSPDAVWWHIIPGNFFFFLPGMLLAVLRVRREGDLRRWARHPLARADLWLVVALAFWVTLFLDIHLESRVLPLCVLGTFLVVGAAILPVRRGRLDGVLDRRALALLGIASYSLYLWHWPILERLPHPHGAGIGTWLLFMGYAVPACVIAAAVSYRLIEAPPLRLRRRWFAGSPVEAAVAAPKSVPGPGLGVG